MRHTRPWSRAGRHAGAPRSIKVEKEEMHKNNRFWEGLEALRDGEYSEGGAKIPHVIEPIDLRFIDRPSIIPRDVFLPLFCVHVQAYNKVPRLLDAASVVSARSAFMIDGNTMARFSNGCPSAA